MSEADEQALAFLKDHRLAVLGTGRRDGSPQQSLIGYQFDGKDFAISARGPSAKVRNIRKRPGVSLAVTDGPMVVIVYGQARIVRDAREVLELNLARLQGRRGGEVDREALARRLRDEDRVVVLVTPEKYLPSRLEGRR